LFACATAAAFAFRRVIRHAILRSYLVDYFQTLVS
jgi:hypothetical protein